MFSKCIRLMTQVPVMVRVPARSFGNLIPKDQYDQRVPDRLRLGYALRVYWEIIPLFICTCISMGLAISSIISAVRNKVDVTYTTHSRKNISRTMDLNHPTIHKLVTINQEYPPWPRMQAVLDKMKEAERQALYRAMMPEK